MEGRTIMSKKIIGIKQADGSFFPILNDGEPSNKTLELTTVRDGQTAVKINLFKQYEDTEELEYVDTLLIENLVPHLKEEPSFKLSINLDDDNVLTAEVLDPETGAKSDTSVSLVTLSEAQQGEAMDFALADATDAFDDIATSDDATGVEDDFSSLADFEDSGSSDDLSSDFNMENFEGDISSEEGSLGLTDDFNLDALTEESSGANDDFAFPETEALADDLSMEGFGDEPLGETDESPTMDMSDEDFSFPEGDSLGDEMNIEGLSDGLSEDALSLGDENFSFSDSTEISDDLTIEGLNEGMEDSATEEDFTFPTNIELQDDLSPSTEDFSNVLGDMSLEDDFSMDTSEGDVSFEDDTLASDSLAMGDDSISSDSLGMEEESFSTDLPDLGDDTFANESLDLGEDSFSTDSLDLGTGDFSSDSMDLSDDSFSSDSLDLSEPASTDSIDFNEDFDLGTNEGAAFGSDDEMSFADDFDLGEEPASEPSFSSPASDNIQYAEFGEQTKTDNASTSFIPPLYDKKLKDDIQKKRSRKKYPVAMIICVICAIICIIAVILAFAFGRWPGESPSVVNNVVTVEPPQVFEQEKIEDIKAGKDVPPPPTPEENTIEVVVEEEVVPVKPEPAPELRGESISYLLTWGDTLWDLSDTYYRNPWLYTTIADANNIENPDQIIAGTYIDIPPQ